MPILILCFFERQIRLLGFSKPKMAKLRVVQRFGFEYPTAKFGCFGINLGSDSRSQRRYVLLFEVGRIPIHYCVVFFSLAIQKIKYLLLGFGVKILSVHNGINAGVGM